MWLQCDPPRHNWIHSGEMFVTFVRRQKTACFQNGGQLQYWAYRRGSAKRQSIWLGFSDSRPSRHLLAQFPASTAQRSWNKSQDAHVLHVYFGVTVCGGPEFIAVVRLRMWISLEQRIVHIQYRLHFKGKARNKIRSGQKIRIEHEDLRSGHGSYMRSLEKQIPTAIPKELRWSLSWWR